MKIRRLLASSLLLLLLILLVTAILTSPPRPAQAQAVGYVKTGQQAVTATAAQVTGISYGTVCIKGLKANSISRVPRRCGRYDLDRHGAGTGRHPLLCDSERRSVLRDRLDNRGLCVVDSDAVTAQ